MMVRQCPIMLLHACFNQISLTDGRIFCICVIYVCYPSRLQIEAICTDVTLTQPFSHDSCYEWGEQFITKQNFTQNSF